MEYVYMRLACNLPIADISRNRFIIKIGKTRDKNTSNIEHKDCSIRTVCYHITNERLNANDAMNLFYNMVLICKRWGQSYNDFTFKNLSPLVLSKREMRLKHHELANNWFKFDSYKSYIRTINYLVNLMNQYNKVSNV